MSRKLKIFLIFVALVGGGYAASHTLGLFSNGVPEEFKNARLEGAVVAQDIVNLSNEISAELERVNKLDRAGNHAEALTVTAELLKKTVEVKTRALALSAQLEKMTGGLASIKSTDARGAALESIASRLALIGRLLSYGDYLSQLLFTLQLRFSGEASAQKVETLIGQINAEVTAINSFNRQAGQSMDRFDEILKK